MAEEEKVGEDEGKIYAWAATFYFFDIEASRDNAVLMLFVMT